jgi:hypothetical protein
MTEIPPRSFITPEEKLARFVTARAWVRQNKTIKPDAFMPPRDLDLSVTRHKGLTEEEIWQTGQEVARLREGALHGRADIAAEQIRKQKLNVESTPLEENPNHASITGWPTEKPAQKSLAIELSASGSLFALSHRFVGSTPIQ